MSIDYSIKPVGSPAATPIFRPEPEAARTAVTTELPAPKSVTAADTASPATPARTESPPDGNVSRIVMFDQASAEMVFVAVDQNTREVISQYPESWQLKARAYFREQDQFKAQRSGPAATDRTV